MDRRKLLLLCRFQSSSTIIAVIMLSFMYKLPLSAVIYLVGSITGTLSQPSSNQIWFPHEPRQSLGQPRQLSIDSSSPTRRSNGRTSSIDRGFSSSGDSHSRGSLQVCTQLYSLVLSRTQLGQSCGCVKTSVFAAAIIGL